METSGIVYLLSNSAMPGIIKIGLTSRENAETPSLEKREVYEGILFRKTLPFAKEELRGSA